MYFSNSNASISGSCIGATIIHVHTGTFTQEWLTTMLLCYYARCKRLKVTCACADTARTKSDFLTWPSCVTGRPLSCHAGRKTTNAGTALSPLTLLEQQETFTFRYKYCPLSKVGILVATIVIVYVGTLILWPPRPSEFTMYSSCLPSLARGVNNFQVECDMSLYSFRFSSCRMCWSPWIVGALAALGTLSVCVRAQEGGHGEEVVEAVEIAQFCTSSTKVLLEEILELFDSHDYNITINCLAFGQERNLESGVISVFRLDGTTSGRYSLACQRSSLKAQELLGQNASRLDIRDEEHHACLECRPTEAPEEICHDRKSVLLYL